MGALCGSPHVALRVSDDSSAPPTREEGSGVYNDLGVWYLYPRS